MGRFVKVHSVQVAKQTEPYTFGKLTAIGPRFVVTVKKSRTVMVVTECGCGGTKVARMCDLKSGKTSSCGCLITETLIKRNTKHKLSRTPEHRIWCSMCSRCHNKNGKQYKDWGGRGIQVCARWREPNGQGFLNFLADMGPRPEGCVRYTIERKNVDGHYCPDNCVWATYEEQNNNTRANVLLTYADKTQTATKWAKEIGIPASVIQERVRKGWADADTLTTPYTKKVVATYSYDGKTMCLSDWAKHIGASVIALKSRLSKGWALDKALTTPFTTYKKKEKHADE